MQRREFIAGLGSAATAWPLVAQSQTTVPVIGFLHSSSLEETRRDLLAVFLRGLAETGYIEGRNVAIEYRWADDRNERLAGLAADLVRRRVAVIVTPSTAATLAAKAATDTVPIVFVSGADPVEIGLVSSLNRPGSNLTGTTSFAFEMAAKRLEMLHAFVPTATLIAYLVDPTNRAIAEREPRLAQAAAHTLGVRLLTLSASTPSEIEAAFESLIHQQAGGLLIGNHPFFVSQRDQIVALAAAHRVPAIYDRKEAVAAGGLMSYGASLADAYRQVATYVGRLLRGEKPADLPVQQSVKIELVINMKAAMVLGLTIPETLLATADEVIQ